MHCFNIDLNTKIQCTLTCLLYLLLYIGIATLLIYIMSSGRGRIPNERSSDSDATATQEVDGVNSGAAKRPRTAGKKGASAKKARSSQRTSSRLQQRFGDYVEDPEDEDLDEGIDERVSPDAVLEGEEDDKGSDRAPHGGS